MTSLETSSNTCAHFFSHGKKIENMLQVSVSTIQRRRREFRLSDEFERYSDITDDEQLDQSYESATGNSREGPLTPIMGRGGSLVH